MQLTLRWTTNTLTLTLSFRLKIMTSFQKKVQSVEARGEEAQNCTENITWFNQLRSKLIKQCLNNVNVLITRAIKLNFICNRQAKTRFRWTRVSVVERLPLWKPGPESYWSATEEFYWSKSWREHLCSGKKVKKDGVRDQSILKQKCLSIPQLILTLS